jgi:glycopeptide antibiotics resistance protein
LIFALEDLGESEMLPWFLPAVVIWVAVALAVGGRVGRALGVRRAVSVALVVSLGIILSATLTPLRGALDFGAVGSGSCDLSRVGLAPLRGLLRLNETSLNVLLFVPLGVSIASLPRSRLKAAFVVAAIALPFAIETIQLLVPWLDRACESADVVDNLTGLAIGLAGGVVAGRLAAAVDRRPR